MKPAARMGDIFKGMCAHGCKRCVHTIVGYSGSITQSPNVFINARPSVRLGDKGRHMLCCGPNISTHVRGSTTVFVNGRPVVRMGDSLITCGGFFATIVQGSPNVLIGG